MYCPQCSQQQLSDEMRFCSRCGFSLNGVRELMSKAKVPEISSEEKVESRRAVWLKGSRRGVLLMLIALPIAAVVGVITAEDDDFAVLFLIPFLLVVIGLIRTLYGIFCQGRTKKAQLETSEPRVLETQQFRALEHAKTVSSVEFSPARQTAEVRQPASVTENTTRLLDEESNSRVN
jgi:hypothetical protein